MQRDEALQKIAGLRPELDALGVRSLHLFGSVARGEAAAGSDLDLLVEFDRLVRLFHFVRVRDFLSRELGGEVDLLTRDALSADLRDSVLKPFVPRRSHEQRLRGGDKEPHYSLPARARTQLLSRWDR